MSGDRLLVALYGPTSSGKTALSVDVAHRLRRTLDRPVTVISADSRQVYRYMDIGTSKTTVEEMRGIPHEMLDVVEPDHKLELEEYARRAREHIGAAFAAGRVPFVVGGTGVYVKALVDGWEMDAVGAARRGLRQDFPRSMAADAHAMLRRLDKAAAAKVHPNNYEAVINALAARMASSGGSGGGTAAPRTVLLGLDPGPRAVDERLAATYDRQVERGLLDEIEELNERYDLEREKRRRGADSPNQVLHTHGYREYFDVAAARGRPLANLTAADRAQVREQVLEHIRGYTRRQRSWFKKLPGVKMVTSPGQAAAAIAKSR
ncbi:tRNA dimethylallyltransferase [Virgisporangium aliadipatigenens]|uniref:tRNA dimethylallyltransferase n=1 Tax=Virgisporangium aliadipatigenens TaxID=741659 RepID=A0A8J4DVX6_9ACTN|nr:tRNA (adenosine(37)-N6)-dimethylallyltransferase MiaA [Virgisporangium aliadipatigenens]GIJ51911.1 tRNA dimethylallyltransferase [Virgisporangium aliadipatigenens]